jgi:1-phosphofructokinase family hexose kinase
MILVCGHNNAWQLTYRFDAVTRGAVNRVHEVHRSAAGKGVNVARVLAALQAPATLLAFLGGPNGVRVRQALAAEGIAVEVIDTAADTRTCVTLLETGTASAHDDRAAEPVLAAGETRHVTELVEPAVTASGAEQARFAAAYDRLVERASVVVIAGSAIGGADRDAYTDMVRRAQRRGVPTLLDAYHGHGRAALAAAPEIVKINRAELAELVGTAVDTEAARTAAYRALCDRYGVQWVIVSAGAEGIEAYDGARLLRAAAPAVPVVNSIGSGDAASAGVAAALVGAAPATVRIAQADLAAALRQAVACGSANCLTATPGSVTRAAIIGLRAKVAVTETPV